MSRFHLRCSALLVTILALGLLTLAVSGAPAALGTTAGDGDVVSFEQQVWPILQASCTECHDSRSAFSNLRLDNAEGIMAGGDLGKVVVPGEPDNSPLVLRVALPEDDLDFMPIEGDPLTEEQIELMRKWIEQGADFGGWTGKSG